jgi:hypothetical protein
LMYQASASVSRHPNQVRMTGWQISGLRCQWN